MGDRAGGIRDPRVDAPERISVQGRGLPGIGLIKDGGQGGYERGG